MWFRESTKSFAELMEDGAFQQTNLCVNEERFNTLNTRNAAWVKSYIDKQPGAILTTMQMLDLHELRNGDMATYAGVIDGCRAQRYFREPEEQLDTAGTIGIGRIPHEMELLDAQVKEMAAQISSREDALKVQTFFLLRMFCIHPFTDANKRLFRDALEAYLVHQHDSTLPEQWQGISDKAMLMAVKGNNIGLFCQELNDSLKLGLDAKQFVGIQLTAHKIMPEVLGEYRMTPEQYARSSELLGGSEAEWWGPVYEGMNLSMADELKRSRHSEAAICGLGPLVRPEHIDRAFGLGHAERLYPALSACRSLDALFEELLEQIQEPRLEGDVMGKLGTLMRYASYSAGEDEQPGRLTLLAIYRCMNQGGSLTSAMVAINAEEAEYQRQPVDTAQEKLNRGAWMKCQLLKERQIWQGIEAAELAEEVDSDHRTVHLFLPGLQRHEGGEEKTRVDTPRQSTTSCFPL